MTIFIHINLSKKSIDEHIFKKFKTEPFLKS